MKIIFHKARRVGSAILISLQFIISTNTFADWGNGLHGQSEKAQEVIQRLCAERASENIFGVANNTRSVLIRVSDNYVRPDISFNSEMSGANATNLPYNYLRFGLTSVQFDPRLTGLYGGPQNKEHSVAVFDTSTRDTSFKDAYDAPIEIIFSRETNDSEESLGIYGRTIVIKRRLTGEILGKRTEFYWFIGSDPRTRIRHEKALCPEFTYSYQSQPQYFIGEVINPGSYSCMRQYIKDMTTLKQETLAKSKLVTNNRNAFDKLMADKRENENQMFSLLSECHNSYNNENIKTNSASEESKGSEQIEKTNSRNPFKQLYGERGSTQSRTNHS